MDSDLPPRGQLLDWQWRGYPTYHGSRANLLLHIVVVPMFVAANVTLLVALARGAWLLAGIAAVTMAVSVVLQGIGHKQEQVPPLPFHGPSNAVLRIFGEQWITFPRFVLSGGWWRAVRRQG